MEKKKESFITEKTRKLLRQELAVMKEPVTIVAVLSDEIDEPFSLFCRKLLQELSALSDKIIPVFEKPGSITAEKYKVSRTPTLLVAPERFSIRFSGAPAGEETRTFLITLLMASVGKTILSDASKLRLAELKENRSIKVFVSPTCPYCPTQVLLAVCAAMEKADLVKTEIIDIYENRDLASEYNAFSVPQVFIDEHLVGMGLQPEEVFIEEVMSAVPVKVEEFKGSGVVEIDLVIVGAGPAGLTAAIYAERSGIAAVILEKGTIGGQVAITPVVENYPGFTRIGGMALMDMMAQQAVRYTDIHQGEELLNAEKKNDHFEIITNRAVYKAKAVLIASGAESRKLDVPGEKEFHGRGVSYCASCDGYFFKDGKKVFVIGGGNTAATEALYLKNIGAEVTLIHRRDKLRAESLLQKRLSEAGIPMLLNTVVKEIRGEKSVNAVLFENVDSKVITELPAEGIFIAAGYVPNNDLAKKLGVDTDDEGYIKVNNRHQTSVPGIYAAGDITGGFKQIVTAVGQGSIAANSIFEDIAKPYRQEKT